MADLKQFAEQLVNLTVKEVNECLKDEYGIRPAAAAVVVYQVVVKLLLKSSNRIHSSIERSWCF
jgi:hypothetical protein